MKGIKIEVLSKTKKSEFVWCPYRLKIDLGKWDLTQDVSEKELIKIRNEINEALGLTEITTVFDVSVQDAEEIRKFQRKYDSPSSGCTQKMRSCRECVFVLQSPLERKLFVAMKDEAIIFKLQQRIHKDGSIHDYDTIIDRSKIRTIPDFLLNSKSGKTICVYADGHTYHERTEYQALRDRSIDRDVQLFGYTVLRFTGKEINSDLQSVIQQVKQVVDN